MGRIEDDLNIEKMHYFLKTTIKRTKVQYRRLQKTTEDKNKIREEKHIL